jgi:hypothetical protein
VRLFYTPVSPHLRQFCGIFGGMRIKLLSLFLLIGFFAAKSQTLFQKTYGKIPHDYAYSMEKTFDGGFIVAGLTNSYGGSFGFYLLKTDSLGDTLWVKGYASGGIIYGYSIQQTVDTGFIAAGNNGILKTDKQGNISWGLNYSGVTFYSVQQTSDGGYILSGSIGSTSSSNGIDVYLLRLNSTGTKLWSRKIGGAMDEVSTCIRQTSDGGYVSLGYTNSFGAGTNDLYLLRMNSLGDTLWTRTYGNTGTDGNSSNRQNLEITGDSGFIIGSYTNSFSTNADAYLIKTKANGDTLWTKTYGGVGSEVIYNVRQTKDGGYIFTGYTTSFGAGNTDVYLVRTNSGGDTLWTRTFGGSLAELGQSVIETNDKGFMVAGYSSSFGNGNNDVYIFKTDSAGNSNCNQYNTQTKVNSNPTMVGSTATGKIFITLNITSLNPTFKRGGTIVDVCTLSGVQQFDSENYSVNAFPNPNSGVFTVSFDKKQFEKIKLSIASVLGETIYSATIENNTTIDLSGLSSGVYFLKTDTGKFSTQRIIINK